jgi:hypothetical protein
MHEVTGAKCVVIRLSKLLFNPKVTNVNAAGRSPTEIVGSNPTGGMDICLL